MLLHSQALTFIPLLHFIALPTEETYAVPQVIIVACIPLLVSLSVMHAHQGSSATVLPTPVSNPPPLVCCPVYMHTNENVPYLYNSCTLQAVLL